MPEILDEALPEGDPVREIGLFVSDMTRPLLDQIFKRVDTARMSNRKISPMTLVNIGIGACIKAIQEALNQPNERRTD